MKQRYIISSVIWEKEIKIWHDSKSCTLYLKQVSCFLGIGFFFCSIQQAFPRYDLGLPASHYIKLPWFSGHSIWFCWKEFLSILRKFLVWVNTQRTSKKMKLLLWFGLHFSPEASLCNETTKMTFRATVTNTSNFQDKFWGQTTNYLRILIEFTWSLNNSLIPHVSVHAAMEIYFIYLFIVDLFL